MKLNSYKKYVYKVLTDFIVSYQTDERLFELNGEDEKAGFCFEVVNILKALEHLLLDPDMIKEFFEK